MIFVLNSMNMKRAVDSTLDEKVQACDCEEILVRKPKSAENNSLLWPFWSFAIRSGGKMIFLSESLAKVKKVLS